MANASAGGRCDTPCVESLGMGHETPALHVLGRGVVVSVGAPVPNAGPTRRGSSSTTPRWPIRTRPSTPCSVPGRPDRRSSSSCGSTPPRSAPRSRSPTTCGRRRRSPSRGSTGSTSSCGRTTTTPAPASRSGGRHEGGPHRRRQLRRRTVHGRRRRPTRRRLVRLDRRWPAPALGGKRRSALQSSTANRSTSARPPSPRRPPRPPQTWPPTNSRRSAIVRGAARIIAPAGSGKTRVLTERLRHLIVDRGYETRGVLAVAYNKQAQLEMEARTTDFGPHVRTLNSLGLWVLARHRGSSPGVIDEREIREHRRLVAARKPAPPGQHRPVRPVSRSARRRPARAARPRGGRGGPRRRRRLRRAVPAYRERLAAKRTVDFDEQIYSAIEALLRGPRVPSRHAAVVPPSARRRVPGSAPAHVLLLRLLASPSSTCSASATTTSASTAMPAPTRSS